ncbi:MAG: single-stranded DNA-binding protein, partial [Oscillospiraceae bacterium]
SGIACASFTVAWSEKYKETETQLFLDCTAWRATAELICKHFTKGKEIIVEGKLHTEKWEDKEGNKRTSIKMTVERVHFCGKKSDSEGESGGTYKPVKYGASADISPDEDDGELPF